MLYSDGWSDCPRYTGSTISHSFPSKNCMVRHHRPSGDHRESRYFRCIYCDYQSKYSSNVYKHNNECGQRYSCPRCCSSFSKKGNMLTHFRHECGKEPRYQCPYCGKKDRKSSNTYRHIRMYHKGSNIHAYRLY
ncbi:hypothetical protein ACFW04_005945 [Cataglyphis niger]